MADRRHWRFVVRDQYGYVIQNAKVNVYQPGTSNSFTGTAYNAATGGGTVTNPFTTNSQGEVEAWFDTAQTVDVQVDDNTDTAYRAVNGASATVSFTTFIEADDIAVDPTDLPTAIGTATDLTDITAAAQTEAVGTSGRWAPMDHVHGHSAFSANTHGHADHTNRIRSIWLDSQNAFPITGAAATTLGTTPNTIRYLAYLDAATNEAMWNFVVPEDYLSGALLAQVSWVPISTDGTPHTVRWEYVVKKRTAGDDVTAAGTTVTFTGNSAARTANLLVQDANTSTTVTPAAAGEVVQFTLRRIGADGADTYVGTVGVVGVNVTYTADM